MADKTLRVRLEAVTDQFSAKMRQAANETRTHGSAMARSARDNRAEWTTAGLAIGAAGAAITLGLRKAGNEAAAFQATLMRSTTLVGISTDEMQRMGQAALGMGETGRGPQELGRALFFAQSAGLRGAAALDVVEASAKAAAIGLGDTATVTDLVTSAVNAYGSESLSASGATDILIGAVREGKAEASELAGSMGMVLPIASQMGVSFDQVGSAMAAMTRTGTNASMAGTQLRAMLVALLKPAQGAEEAMNQVGLSSEGLRRTIQEDGLFAALMQVRTAVGDNDAAMARIFPNVRALAGVMDLTGANSAETAQIFERMTDTTGLLADGFAQWSTTTEAAQQRFSASMEAARIALGEGLQPAMVATLDTGTALAQAFTDLPEGLRQIVAVGGGAVGVTASLAGAFLLLAPRIVMTRDAMRTLNITTATSARALGRWTPILAAAALAVSEFSRVQGLARQASDSLTAHLDDVRGGAEGLSDAWLTQQLEAMGALHTWEKLGIPLSTLRGSLRGVDEDVRTIEKALGSSHGVLAGHADAWHNVTGGLVGSRNEYRQLQTQLGALRGETEDFLPSLEELEARQRGNEASSARLTALARHLGGEFGTMADASDDFAGSLDELDDQAADTRTSLEKLTDILDELIGVNQTAERANIALLEGWEDLTDALDENGSTLDVNTEKGRDNRKAILDQVDAIKDDLRARHDQGESLADIAVRYDEQVDKLRGVLRQANLTEDEIEDYIETLGMTPEQVLTAIVADDRASSIIANVIRQLGRIPKLTTTEIRTTRTAVAVGGGNTRIHTGGEIVPGGVRRFHGGGAAGGDGAALGLSPFGRLAPDEVPAILQTGEWVLSRQQVSMLTGALGSAMRFHGGGQVPAPSAAVGGLTVQQTFAADVSRSTLAEARHQQRLAYLESR